MAQSIQGIAIIGRWPRRERALKSGRGQRPAPETGMRSPGLPTMSVSIISRGDQTSRDRCPRVPRLRQKDPNRRFQIDQCDWPHAVNVRPVSGPAPNRAEICATVTLNSPLAISSAISASAYVHEGSVTSVSRTMAPAFLTRTR